MIPIPTGLLLKAIAAAVVAAALATAYFGWRGQQREIGRQEVRAAYEAATDAQEDRNRELQRAAEKRYVVEAGVRDRFITKTVREIRYVAAPLATCPVPDAARGMLNDAATCARGDSPAACGADGKLRNP